MYTKETLASINDRYIKCGHHWLNDIDVKKANEFVNLIESTRSTETPKAGDILIFTDKFGEYFPNAHIDKAATGYGGNICEHAYVPFISAKADGILCNTSGGAWHDVLFSKMEYVGTQSKRFCFWGSCGACADGAVEIEAKVSVWKYAEELLIPGYTTENYNRYFLHDSGEDSKYTKESGYRFHVTTSGAMAHRAFKDKDELDAWLDTFNGNVFDRSPQNTAIVWTWKQCDAHVSPREFEAIPEPVDTMLFNGAVRKCKRIYDEAKHTVTTCFVWYWEDDSIEDWHERAMMQNKIREEKYTLPWNTPEFILARERRAS